MRGTWIMNYSFSQRICVTITLCFTLALCHNLLSMKSWKRAQRLCLVGTSLDNYKRSGTASVK